MTKEMLFGDAFPEWAPNPPGVEDQNRHVGLFSLKLHPD